MDHPNILHDLEKAVKICIDNKYYNTAYSGNKDIRWEGAYEACKKVLDNYNAIKTKEIEEKILKDSKFINNIAKKLPNLPHDEELGSKLSKVP